MFRTLQQLKDSVDNLIEQQGQDAPCYAIVMTKEDVFRLDADNNKITIDIVDVERVFENMDDSDWLYEKFNEEIKYSMSETGV